MFRFFCALLLLGSLSLTAQKDFKIAAAGKTVEFREIDRLDIVGVAGSEMVITGAENGGNQDERAAGLRKISASGITDNTGFGLSVLERDGKLFVEQVGGKGRRLTVKVPNSALVRVEQTTHRGGDLSVSDFSGELDVSMMYHRAKLSNVSGPIAVNTVYDAVEATFTRAPTAEVRLHSTYSDVDVTLPAATKADLRLKTSYGEMYTDFDIAIKPNMTASTARRSGNDNAADRKNLARVRGEDGDDHRHDHDHDCDNCGGATMNGTINGGGQLIALSATYDNIYLRKR